MYRLGEKEVVILRFDSKVLEDGVRPKSLHVILNDRVSYPVMRIASARSVVID